MESHEDMAGLSVDEFHRSRGTDLLQSCQGIPVDLPSVLDQNVRYTSLRPECELGRR